MTGLLVAAAVVVIVLAVLVAWRLSSKGRASSEIRDMERHHHPSSPYGTVNRFRVIDETTPPPPAARPAPARPRLDSREYVFGDVAPPVTESVSPTRHDSHWALERTARRRRRRWRSRQWLRLGVIILVLVLGAGYLVQRGRGVITTTTTSTTTTTWPKSFTASVSGKSAATLTVPKENYTVTLTATSAATVRVLGPSGTYFSGNLAAGQSKTVSVSGFVTVDFITTGLKLSLSGAPVTLPQESVVPFWLTISPTG